MRDKLKKSENSKYTLNGSIDAPVSWKRDDKRPSLDTALKNTNTSIK